MITTVIHRLDVSDMQWHVSHLFEHLVIRGFLAMIDQEHERSELIGWVNGETFKEALYIDAGFYEPRLAELFEQYLGSLPVFSDAEIEHALRIASTEDRVTLEIKDRPAFVEQIATLSHRPWDEMLSGKSSVNVDVVSETVAEEKFNDIALVAQVDSLSAEEQKVMLRLRTIVIDLVLCSLDKHGVYPLGNSELAVRGDAMAYMSLLTTGRDLDGDDIQYAVEDYVQTYDVDGAVPAIERHFEVFANEPLWQSIPIEYFRDTGISVTNREIASLATPEVIKSIFSKLHFTVRDAQEEDYAHIK